MKTGTVSADKGKHVFIVKIILNNHKIIIWLGFHMIRTILEISVSNSKMPGDDGQGRSQSSEQDEASFEPLVGSGGMPPPPLQKILKSRGSEMLL